MLPYLLCKLGSTENFLISLTFEPHPSRRKKIWYIYNRCMNQNIENPKYQMTTALLSLTTGTVCWPHYTAPSPGATSCLIIKQWHFWRVESMQVYPKRSWEGSGQDNDDILGKWPAVTLFLKECVWGKLRAQMVWVNPVWTGWMWCLLCGPHSNQD